MTRNTTGKRDARHWPRTVAGMATDERTDRQDTDSITFSDAAALLDVAAATISRWAGEGTLITTTLDQVTRASVSTLLERRQRRDARPATTARTTHPFAELAGRDRARRGSLYPSLF